MDRRQFLRGFAASACLCPACATVARASEAPHWSYEGHGAPKEWGSLSPEYAACSAGKEQSPIDLKGPIPAMLRPPVINWQPGPCEVLNNGHTIQVNCSPGSNLVLDGMVYDLLQFHFHRPSEHTIEGIVFDMEAHFVHKAPTGGLAVLGVMISKGAANTALEPVWKVMPDKAGAKVAMDQPLNPVTLLPTDSTTYRYAGSLTTPPCSEVVSWVVYRQAVTASDEQIKRFAALFPNNARPVQPLNRRKLLLDLL
jgi:carbonic anhydrase